MAKITACSTLVYTTGRLHEAVERIAARGFSRVEIAHTGKSCTHCSENWKSQDRREKS